MYDNSDEYEFTPSASSKLSSLFGTTIKSNDLSSDLTYTAPKQPKIQTPIENSPKDKSKSIVLVAKIISLWELNNGTYKLLGRHGLAIIGSADLNIYEIIAYKEKNNIKLRIKVNNNLKFYNQKDNFSTFYDINLQNWLVKFDTIAQQNEFSERVSSYGGEVIQLQNNIQEKELNVKPELLPKPIVSQDPIEEHQLNESDSQNKTNILHRMAKMGQQILPKQLMRSSSSDISDSDHEHDNKAPPRRTKKNLHVEKIISPKKDDPIHNHPLVLPSYSCPAQFPQPLPFSNFYEGFNQYLMSQNSEIKMNLLQISSKLESVLSINPNKQDDNILESKIKALELKCENLQTSLDNSNQNYDKLNKKFQKNNHATEIAEKDNMIDNLRDEQTKLKIALKEMEDKMDKYHDLENELIESKRKIEENEITINTYSKKEIEGEEQVRILQDTIENLNLELKDFKKAEYEKRSQYDKNEETVNKISNMIKKEMEEMYQQLMADFDENSSFSSREIRARIVKELKKTSFKMIENSRDICIQGADVLYS